MSRCLDPRTSLRTLLFVNVSVVVNVEQLLPRSMHKRNRHLFALLSAQV